MDIIFWNSLSIYQKICTYKTVEHFIILKYKINIYIDKIEDLY